MLSAAGELLLADGRSTSRLNPTPPFLELALTALAVLLLVWRPAVLGRALRRAWRRLATRSCRWTVVAAGVGALAASAATMIWLGPPVPIVPDELAYLLLGETFSHGRSTNPSPAVPEAFEGIEHIVRPTYTAKYPPAQGVFIAAGRLLGHPAIGLCLCTALLAAVSCWFLQGWLRAPWPLVGAALLTLRVGLGSYWGQTYWGGAALAVGALLVYGSLPRLFGRRARLPWLPLAAGVLLLATSRPFEGALAALPAAAIVGARLWQRRRPWRLTAAALAGSLALAAALVVAYNSSVTGKPFLHPYQLHIRTYGVAISPYVAPPGVRYSSPVLAAYFGKSDPTPHTAAAASIRGAAHFARMAYFVCGLPLLAGLVFGLCRLVSPAQRWWKLLALLCAVLPAAQHSVTAWWWPHYSATATGPLLLLATIGLRQAAARLRLGGLPVVWLPAAALAIQTSLTLVALPRQRPGTDAEARLRPRLEAELAQRGERAVVVVDDRLRMEKEWVFNHADLASAPILWIQDLGPAVTRQVAAAYGPRNVYVLEPTDGEGALPHLRALHDLDTTPPR